MTTHLVLFEVTEGSHDDGAAALLLGVPGLQPHDALGHVDQVLDLPLVLQDFFLFFLESQHEHEGANRLRCREVLQHNDGQFLQFF